ncbi:MAG: CPBP family intramembrane glutamic endopeptidase [Acidimicrobiales bacterium]
MGDACQDDPGATSMPGVHAGSPPEDGGQPPPGWVPPPPGLPPPAPGWPPPAPGWPPPAPGWPPPTPPPASGPVDDEPFLDVPGAAPATRGDAAAWVAFALLGFIAGQLVALVLTVVAASIAGQGNQLSRIASMAKPPEWYIAVSLIGLWVGFFGGPWIATKARGTGRLLADLGVRFRMVDLWGLLIGVGAQILVGILYAPFIKHLKNFNAPTQKLTGGSHGVGFVLIAVLTVVGAPFFEELFFRGLLFRALARLFTPSRLGPGTARTVGLVGAVVVDGLLFGLAHGELEQLAGLAVFGMVLAAVSYRTGRLGMNIVSHASFNLVAVLALAGSRGGVLH